MKKLLIFGNGQLADVAYYYFKNDSDHVLHGFFIDDDYYSKSTFHNYPVIPFSEFMKLNPNDYNVFVPISYKRMNSVREERFCAIKKLGFSFVSYISSKSIIFTKLIGENNFILENNVIQPYVKIGNNNIFWSGNHIGHHSSIESNNFISSHVVISGNVKIKNNNFFGVNSAVKDNISIGSFNLLNMGTFVEESILDNCIIRNNKDLISKKYVTNTRRFI